MADFDTDVAKWRELMVELSFDTAVGNLGIEVCHTQDFVG